MDSGSNDDDDKTTFRPRPRSGTPSQAGAAPAEAPPAPAAAQADAGLLGNGPAATQADAAPLGSGPAAPAPAAPRTLSGNALPPGTKLGEFELLRVLGEGGFGIVYVAMDHTLERQVALKEYMPSSLASRAEDSRVQVRSEQYQETFDIGLRSFVNEAKALAQFDHPSLVKVFRFWEANGTAYMVMPLYKGTTLRQRLMQGGPADDEAWWMATLGALTEALAVIHAENWFHRDIAPDNIILLEGSGKPLLLDFGAARRVIGDMTQALTVILKPGYAPIEQYAEVADMKQGPWTDVYALAATVHFGLRRKTPPPSVARLVNDAYEPLATALAGRFSERFLRALDNALQVRPGDRTPDIAAFRAELGLDGAASTSVLPARVPTSAPPVPAPVGVSAGEAASPAPERRVPMAAWAGLVVALGIAATAAALWMRKPVPAAAPPAAQVVPAVAPTASAAVPISVKAFEVRDEFDRVLRGATPDFKVDAVPTQAALKIGKDKLSFKVTSSRAGFVHVLVLGPDGSLMLLFPNGQFANNSIKAGQTLTLPHAQWQLDTVEPAGKEDFLVLVTEQPRDYSELSKEYDYIFLKLPTGQRAAELAAGWTRSTPLLLGGMRGCSKVDCEAYGAALFSVDVQR